MAREIKLNGREKSIIRTIGFGLPITGADLLERLNMDPQDLADALSSMLQYGYLEAASMKEELEPDELLFETFEINPAFGSELREAIKR